MSYHIVVALIIITLVVESCPDTEMYKAKAKFACSQHGEIYALNGLAGAVCNDGTTVSQRVIEDTIISDPSYFPTHKE